MNDVLTKGHPPYIFVDVDGVLNSRRSANAHGGFGQPSNPTKLDVTAVKLLQWLAGETDACVVVSSSWRGGGPAEFAAWMASYGWYNCPVVGETKSRTDYTRPRGSIIKEWLSNYASRTLQSENYLIVDDNSDAGKNHPDYCFVQTSFEDGLTWSKYKRCQRKLKHREMHRKLSGTDA